MKDEEILRTLLSEEYEEQLTDKERDAFESMYTRTLVQPLTEKQQAWVKGVAQRLKVPGIVEAARNLFSELSEKDQREHRALAAAVKLPWESGAQPRPLKPPGRA